MSKRCEDVVNLFMVGNMHVDLNACYDVHASKTSLTLVNGYSIWFLFGKCIVVERGTSYDRNVVIAYGDSREELLVWADVNNLDMRRDDERQEKDDEEEEKL